MSDLKGSDGFGSVPCQCAMYVHRVRAFCTRLGFSLPPLAARWGFVPPPPIFSLCFFCRLSCLRGCLFFNSFPSSLSWICFCPFGFQIIFPFARYLLSVRLAHSNRISSFYTWVPRNVLAAIVLVHMNERSLLIGFFSFIKIRSYF